jgi:hypothetical protein
LLLFFVQTVIAAPAVLRIETLSGLNFPENEPVISVDLHTLESSEKSHYWIEFSVSQPYQYSTTEFRVTSEELDDAIIGFQRLKEKWKTDKGYSNGKLSQVVELGDSASIGYYFGYAFDDGWILMSGGNGLWMEEETLEEFEAFLQSASATLKARLKIE